MFAFGAQVGRKARVRLAMNPRSSPCLLSRQNAASALLGAHDFPTQRPKMLALRAFFPFLFFPFFFFFGPRLTLRFNMVFFGLLDLKVRVDLTVHRKLSSGKATDLGTDLPAAFSHDCCCVYIIYIYTSLFIVV